MANKETENSDGHGPKKKVKKPSRVVKETVEGVSKYEQIKLEHLFAQAVQRFKDEELLDKKQKVSEVQHLACIIEEYLSGFILLGYSMQGEKVCVFSAENSKDEGAVVDLLRSTFFDITSNRP